MNTIAMDGVPTPLRCFSECHSAEMFTDDGVETVTSVEQVSGHRLASVENVPEGAESGHFFQDGGDRERLTVTINQAFPTSGPGGCLCDCDCFCFIIIFYLIRRLAWLCTG